MPIETGLAMNLAAAIKLTAKPAPTPCHFLQEPCHFYKNREK
jgi:hypothetical protein